MRPLPFVVSFLLATATAPGAAGEAFLVRARALLTGWREAVRSEEATDAVG